jgi:hypothetical protein
MVICTCVRFTSRRLTNWRRWWRLPRGTTTMRVSCFAFMLILFHVCVFYAHKSDDFLYSPMTLRTFQFSAPSAIARFWRGTTHSACTSTVTLVRSATLSDVTSFFLNFKLSRTLASRYFAMQHYTVSLTRASADTAAFADGATFVSFVGARATLRRGDGSLHTLSIPPLPTLLYGK